MSNVIEKKKISLGFAEQAQLVAILNGFKGNMTDLAYALDDMKIVKITDEELKNAGAVDHIDPRTGMKNGAISWDTEKVDALGEKEFEVSQITVDYAKKNIEDRSKRNELTIRDAGTLALLKKLS